MFPSVPFGAWMETFYIMCLETLIGIRSGCGTITAPDSGLWLNDLPGIEISRVDAAVNSESESAYDLIETKISEASSLIKNRLVDYLEPKFKTNSIIENDVLGTWRDDLEAESLSSSYLYGVQVDIDRPAFLKFFLSQVAVHSSATNPITVELWDLISGVQLTTFSVTPTMANQPEYKDIYYDFGGQKQPINLFIGIDGASAMYKTDLNANCSSCSGNWYSIDYGRFQGARIAKASAKTETNIEAHTGTAGLSLHYSLNCDYERFVCSVKSRLARALRYKTASMLMDEMIYSTRFNSIVTLYMEDHRELKEMYEMEYLKELESVFQYMNSSAFPDHKCFSCHRLTRTQFSR